MTNVIISFFGSLFPAILYNVRVKRFFWVGLSGALGWIAYDFINKFFGNVVFATFAGALVVGLYSELIARIIKAPAIVFSVSGIFPLVPGLGAYQTAQLLIENNLIEGLAKGLETFASAASIAIGIMVMSGAFKASKRVISNRKLRSYLEKVK